MNISAVFFRFLPYVLLLGSGLWLQENQDILKRVPDMVLANLTYVVAIVGGAFAWFFHRGNIALALAFSTVCFYLDDQAGGLGSAQMVFMMAALGVCLPFNAMLLAVWEERGVLTASGLLKVIFLTVQVGAILLITFGQDRSMMHEVTGILIFDPIGVKFPYWSQVPFSSIVLFGLASFWMLGVSLKKGLPVETAWLAYLIATGAVFIADYNNQLFFSVASLSLVIGVIQDSYRMAFLDELTGIPARRALISDMKKLGSRYVVAMADIDHFKKFNDTHGHDVGDQVLRMVATNMTKVTGGGQAYRYGGEEFTILFPNKSLDEAMEHLEKVRARIEEASFTIRGKERPKKKPKKGQKATKPGNQVVRVTSSFGAAEKSKGMKDPMAVMKAADEALYRAKKAGRNQVSK